MAITINSTVERKDCKIIYFTIEYDGKDYKWHGKMPKDADAQDYWDAKEEDLKEKILRKQYLEAVVPEIEGKSSLESFEAWVSAGCKNAEVKGIDIESKEIVIKAEEVIEKKAWVDSEPSVDTATLIAELQEKIKALES
jgi:ABC-type lipoprotein release transport system permease subunit